MTAKETLPSLAARIALPLALLAAAAGCDGEGAAGRTLSSPGGGPGARPALEVVVTDLPFPAPCFVEASVTIDSVEIVPEGGGAPILLPMAPETVNLLDLNGGATERIAAAPSLAAGRYTRARVHVSRGALTFANGSQRLFDGPADPVEAAIVPALVIAGEPGTGTATPAPTASPTAGARLTIDFDLPQTFRFGGTAGPSDCAAIEAEPVTFAPFFHATGNTGTARIEGVARASSGAGVPDATVRANSRGQGPRSYVTLTSDGSSAAETGAFVMLVEPGTYVLSFEHPTFGTVPPVEVTVGEGGAVRQDATFP